MFLLALVIPVGMCILLSFLHAFGLGIVPNNFTLDNYSAVFAKGSDDLAAPIRTIWLALGAFWIINSTYERYRGRTDLDMPEWFAINVDVMFKVLPIAGLAGVLDVIAGCLFIACARRTGWALRAGFALQWLASAAIVGLLVWSVLPHE